MPAKIKPFAPSKVPKARGIVAAKSSQRNVVANNRAPKPGKGAKL